MSEPTGATTSVEDDVEAGEYSADDEFGGETPSEYTTESAQDSGARAVARRPVVTGNAGGTGRRKEAIARVRIMPGSGQWLINGRSLDVYFPNKVHQQLINEPFVTLGAEGVLAGTAQGEIHSPALPVSVVDTTAAGDAFNGALAAALGSGDRLESALRFANAAAALACTRRGAQPSLPIRAEVDRLLQAGERAG